MEERPLPEETALPRFRAGQSYLDHAERMLLDLFQDLRGLLKNPELTGSERVAAAGIALAAVETMQALGEPHPSDADADNEPGMLTLYQDEEGEDDDTDRRGRPARRR